MSSLLGLFKVFLIFGLCLSYSFLKFSTFLRTQGIGNLLLFYQELKSGFQFLWGYKSNMEERHKVFLPQKFCKLWIQVVVNLRGLVVHIEHCQTNHFLAVPVLLLVSRVHGIFHLCNDIFSHFKRVVSNLLVNPSDSFMWEDFKVIWGGNFQFVGIFKSVTQYSDFSLLSFYLLFHHLVVSLWFYLLFMIPIQINFSNVLPGVVAY